MSSGQPSVENGQSPEREPGVEHVGILLDRSAAMRAVDECLRFGDDGLAALLAVPDRDAVPPPELAGDDQSWMFSIQLR